MKTKKNKLIKRTIKIVIAIIICLLFTCYYIDNNFATYCIYYAKHIPHAKGNNPEMVLILDYLDSMGESSVEGIKYDTDGHNSIINEKNSLILVQAPDSKFVQYEALAGGNFEEYYRTYQFDNSGKFYSYYYQEADTGKDIYDKSDIRKQEAQAYVDEVINPIVEKMEAKPTVNLQWLFNKKYQERFSDE